MGPILMGIFTRITGSMRTGVISLIILFIIGLLIMIRLPKDIVN
jgi:UMF1 family MFS transporter